MDTKIKEKPDLLSPSVLAFVGDAVYGELHKSREDLEAFAELFDFSVIP